MILMERENLDENPNNDINIQLVAEEKKQQKPQIAETFIIIRENRELISNKQKETSKASGSQL